MTARCYIADLPPHRWHEGGSVRCGQRVRRYGTPEPIEQARDRLQSLCMCAARR